MSAQENTEENNQIVVEIVLTDVVNNEPGIKILCKPIDLSFLDEKTEGTVHVSVDFGMLDEVIEGSYTFEGDAGDFQCSIDELKQGLIVSMSDYQTIKPELYLSGEKMNNHWMNQTDTIHYYFRYSGKKAADRYQGELPKTGEIRLYSIQISGAICIITSIFLYHRKRRY